MIRFSQKTFESARLRANWKNRSFLGLSYNFSYNYSGQAYEPGMGFQLRDNYMRLGGRLSYGWQFPAESSLQRVQMSMNGILYLNNETRRIESTEYGPSAEFTWKRGDFATGKLLKITEEIPEMFQIANEVTMPTGFYRFPEGEIAYHTPRGKSLRAILRAGGGDFFDGTRFTASIQPVWDPSRVVNLNLFLPV